MIHRVGTSTKGHPVLAGLYRFRETYGLPFDDIFSEMAKRDMIPSVIHLMSEAIEAGANGDRILEQIVSATNYAYCKDWLRPRKD